MRLRLHTVTAATLALATLVVVSTALSAIASPPPAEQRAVSSVE